MAHSDVKWIQDTFQFCPRCGSPSDALGQMPFRCGQCDYTMFFSPAAAVGGLVLDDQKRLLLVRRARQPGKDQWGLPGGFVDRGEAIEEALHREIYEETQLTVSKAELMLTGPNTYAYRGVQTYVVDLFYCCQVNDASRLKLCEEELSEFQWCIPGAAELSNMAFASNRIAVEHWLALRSS